MSRKEFAKKFAEELFNRHKELKSDLPVKQWARSCCRAVHFSSVDKQGNMVEGFYSPDEKIESALIYRNFINK